MDKIIYASEFDSYLEELVFKLFEHDYFGFIKSSRKYVQNIYDFIENKIETFPHKKTPNVLEKNGSLYIFYQPNKSTTWYILFEKKDDRYLISSIFNNYTEEAKYFN